MMRKPLQVSKQGMDISVCALKKKKKITPGAVLEVLWTKSETRETHEPLKLKMVML